MYLVLVVLNSSYEYDSRSFFLLCFFSTFQFWTTTTTIVNLSTLQQVSMARPVIHKTLQARMEAAREKSRRHYAKYVIVLLIVPDTSTIPDKLVKT